MKKYIISFLCLCSLFIFTNVNAEEYELNKLIPVDSSASVKTDKFDYNGFVYHSNTDDKGNSTITFESIKNNKLTSTFVSINLLLFDSNQKNIGLVSYCTDKDLDSNYSDFELAGNGSAPFSIKVVSKYFVEGKSTKDVKYVAVMDDNKYCHVGGYDKYKDLTIDEIANGVSNKDKNPNGLQQLIIEIQEKNLQPIIITVLLSLAGFVILILILKAIIKKIKSRPSTKRHVVEEVPMEETVDLSYSDKNTEDLDLEENVSIGNSNTLEDDSKDVKAESNEESDLTNLFK